MRQRAITAVVLVPVLLIVLVVGGPLLAAGIAAVTAFAALEVFRLLRGAGYPTFAMLGHGARPRGRPRRGHPDRWPGAGRC